MINDIPELVEANIITPETAAKIEAYYVGKKTPSTNRLLVIFGVLGAILVGLGIILIIAHNWDTLPRTVKTIFAFLPLIIGQLLCGYALLKKQESDAWRESASAFLFLAIGASISLVSQIYNMPGNISSFLLIWMLLSLPLIYLMRSSVSSLLYLTGITYYVCETIYWSSGSDNYYFWFLLLAIFPHYYNLYLKKPESNFMVFHNWFIPLSLIITLGTLTNSQEDLMFIAYFSLFGVFFLIGDAAFFNNKRAVSNGYKTLGALGTIILLLSLSFDWYWQDLKVKELIFKEVLTSREFIAAFVLSSLGIWLIAKQLKSRALNQMNPLSYAFILFIICFVVGMFSTTSVILINLIVLGIGLLIIKDGARQDHLGIVNFGLLIVTALVICRFFDDQLSFVIRGAMFLTVGIGFFVLNYKMLKKRKTNEA